MSLTIDIMEDAYNAMLQSGQLYNRVGGRIRPGFAEVDEPTPYITFWPVATTSTSWAMTASGPMAEEKLRMQFDIYTDARTQPSPVEAFEIADDMETILDWLTRSGGKYNNATFRREQYRPQRDEQFWRLTVDYLVTVWAKSPVNN